MNELDLIRLNIYESYDNGELSYGEKEYLLEQVNYMYEKHVSPKRRKENLKRRNEINRKHFEQKYKYDPETKTVELNGKRVPANLDSYTTAMDPNDSTLHTDKFFYRLKSPQQQKAIIDHETGHGSLQSGKKDAPLRNSKLETDQGLYGAALSRAKGLNAVLSTNNERMSNKKTKKIGKDEYKKLMDEMKYDKNKPLDKNQQKRNSVLQKLSKHEVNSNDHANRAEFEADLYASQQQKTGRGQLLAALRNYAKYQNDDMAKRIMHDKRFNKKDGTFNMERYKKKWSESMKASGLDPNDKELQKYRDLALPELSKLSRDNAYKELDKIKKRQYEDYRAREKALYDKSITDEEKSIYRKGDSKKNKPVKESTFETLLESINDLYYDEY